MTLKLKRDFFLAQLVSIQTRILVSHVKEELVMTQNINVDLISYFRGQTAEEERSQLRVYIRSRNCCSPGIFPQMACW